MISENEQKEKSILRLSFIAGLLFAIGELAFSIFSHSQSVLMDAVYDATELIFIALILYLTPLFYKPVSEKHPYGFFQVESIFLVIKGFMMLSVTLGVSTQVIQSALTGGNRVDELQISAFQLFLGLVSVVIYLVMKRMNHSLSSPTVDAELLGWKVDIAYSIGLSAAFFAAMFFEKTPLAFLAPYFDQIMAVGVMILMLPENVKMLWSAMKDVFLFPPDEETVNQIKEVCNGVLEHSTFQPVFFDITKTGRHMWVEIYFEVAEDSLALSELKRMTEAVNRAVGEIFENCTCELLPEP